MFISRMKKLNHKMLLNYQLQYGQLRYKKVSNVNSITINSVTMSFCNGVDKHFNSLGDNHMTVFEECTCDFKTIKQKSEEYFR